MALNYVSLTKEERDLAIAQAIHAREVEWFHYETNRVNYESLLSDPSLANLPAEWPAELVKYQGKKRDEIVAAIKDDATLTSVFNLQQRDDLKRAAKTEAIERDRVAQYHEKLLSSLPAGKDRDEAITAAKAERDTQKTPSKV